MKWKDLHVLHVRNCFATFVRRKIINAHSARSILIIDELNFNQGEIMIIIIMVLIEIIIMILIMEEAFIKVKSRKRPITIK